MLLSKEESEYCSVTTVIATKKKDSKCMPFEPAWFQFAPDRSRKASFGVQHPPLKPEPKSSLRSIYASTHEKPALIGRGYPTNGHGYRRGSSLAFPSGRSCARPATFVDHQLGRNHDQVQCACQRDSTCSYTIWSSAPGNRSEEHTSELQSRF